MRIPIRYHRIADQGVVLLSKWNDWDREAEAGTPRKERDARANN